MYNESKKWFSQTLMYYEDKIYQTDGKLRVGISTNTSDDMNFNPPVFNISVSHNFQKSCSLKIDQAMDLVSSFKQFMAQPDFNNSEILRRIHRSLELSFKFKMDQSNNSVVEIILRSSSTDFSKIIIPANVFQTFAHRLKNFVNNYDQLCYKLLMKNIDAEYRNIINQIPGLIRGISSQIIPVKNPDNRAAVSETVEQEEAAPAEQTIEELDKFLGDDMNNVKVAEIEEKKIENEKEAMFEIHSDFVENVLQGKLETLESMLVTIDGSNTPILDFKNTLNELIGKNYNYLPNMPEEDLKSALYLSKTLCSIITHSHINFDTPIPPSTPILLYKAKDYKDENLELAYDLLLCFGYTRALRNRLNEKTPDFITNRSRFYLQMRLYLDIFCYSFLEKVNKDKLRSIITNRYKYFESIGFFETYKKILDKHKCIPIKSSDIDDFISEACDKIIGKAMYVGDQQDFMVENNSFKLPSSNNFTLEQIINEIIPLEIDDKIGTDLKKVTYVSKEIYNWFVNDTKPKVNKTKKEKTSNIVRFATHYRNEIPEKYRDEFLAWLKAVEDMDFEFDGCEFPLIEFGSNIIKGLYLWKPSEDEKILSSYKYFWGKFEDCMLDKTHILALDKQEDSKDSDEWANTFDNISFE